MTALSDPATLAAGAVLMSALAALAVIDARTFRLPDALTLPLIAAGLAWGAWRGELLASAFGAGLGYLAFVGLELAYQRLRGRAGLGRGDAKLLAAGGAWCGAWMLPLIVLFASASGLVLVLALKLVARRAISAETALPFGPFLAAGTAFAWLLSVIAPPV